MSHFESLCLIVFDEAYCIELTGKTNVLFSLILVAVVVAYSSELGASRQDMGKKFVINLYKIRSGQMYHVCAVLSL